MTTTTKMQFNSPPISLLDDFWKNRHSKVCCST